MKVLLNNVLVKPFPSAEITESGFFVPENAREINNKVWIVEVGSGTKNKPMKLNKGDIGFRVKDWGQEIFIDGERHFIMDQGAILAKD